MADLTNGSGVYQTYSNAGAGVAELGDNKKNANGDTNGIAGLTRVIKLAKSSISDAEIQSVLDALQAGGVKGTDDAVVVVGLEKDTNDAMVAVQGTGVLTPGSSYRGVSGVTMTLESSFAGLKA
jgi:hypothetical protein